MNIECESTIVISCSSELFDKYKNKPFDVILFFENESRCSNRELQIKKTQAESRIVGFHNNKLYPIVRTRSIEISHNYETSKIKVAKYRIIINTETIIINEEIGFLRESINKIECDDGVLYRYEIEIEYKVTSTLLQIFEFEQQLMKSIKLNLPIRYEHIERSSIFSCIGNKVQLWMCFNKNEPYLWANKWNGIKCKLLYNDDGLCIWPDAHDIKMVKFNGCLELIKNVCINAELLDDMIVIFDLLCVKYMNNFFIFEPQTTINYLTYLNAAIQNCMIDDKKLVIQLFYNTNLPSTMNNNCDGFIIFQNNKYIKWKIPTIDLECVDVNKFKAGDIIIDYFCPDAQIGKIYEFAPSPDNLLLLRLRIDRLAPSSIEEIKLFNYACET